MAFNSDHQNSIRRYLLGELSEQEVDHVEQLLISDDEVYQQLLFTEDDLIDDYVSDALSDEERTKFRRRFMAVPELRQSVGFTSALRKHALMTAPKSVAEEPETRKPALFDWLRQFFKQPAFAISFVAVLVAAIALNAWLLRQNSELRGRVEQLKAQQTTAASVDLQEQLASARLRNEQVSAELLRQQQLLAEESRKLQLAQDQVKGPTQRPKASSVLALTLTSGFVRDSGEWAKFSVPTETREVSFRLDLAGGDYRSFQATLQTIEGQPKWSKKNLSFRTGNFVTFNVPASIFTPGDYRVVLHGGNSSGAATEINSYYFRVLK